MATSLQGLEDALSATALDLQVIRIVPLGTSWLSDVGHINPGANCTILQKKGHSPKVFFRCRESCSTPSLPKFSRIVYLGNTAD